VIFLLLVCLFGTLLVSDVIAVYPSNAVPLFSPLPLIIILSVIVGVTYLWVCLPLIAILDYCPMCVTPTVSLKRSLDFTRDNTKADVPDLDTLRDSLCCLRCKNKAMPTVFQSAQFTERATIDDIVTHFDRMRVAPIKLATRVMNSHIVKKCSYSYVSITYRYGRALS